MRLLARRIIEWTIAALIGCAVLAVVALVGFGVVMTRVPEYRAQLQQWLSNRIQLNIEFAALRGRWRWYGPELVFEKAVVRSADRERVLIVAERGGVGFDVWAALRTGRLTAGRFYLSGTELKIVRTTEGKLAVIGQEDLPDFNRTQTLQPDALPIGRLEVRDVRLSFRDLETGRGPWVMRDVQFDVERSTRHVDLRGRAMLPPKLGQDLRFTASSDGSLKNLDELEWRAEVWGTAMDLAGWSQVMPEVWHVPNGGSGSFQVAAVFRGAQPREFSGNVNFSAVRLALPQWSMPLPQADTLQLVNEASKSGAQAAAKVVEQQTVAAPALPMPVVYTRAAANVRAKRSEDTWQIDIDGLQLARPGIDWPAGKASVKWQTSEDGPLGIEARADALVVDNLWPLLAFLDESEQHARWRALDVGGRIEQLQIKMARGNAAQPWQYQVAAQFSRVSIAPVGKWPGAGGLTGKLSVSESAGRVDLDSTDFWLAIPREFRTPLPADKLAGTIAWQREPDAVRVSSDNLQIENGDGRAHASLQLQVPSAGSPVIDLQATASDLNATSAPRYLPAGLLSQQTLAWLDNAFTAGRVANAELTLRGPLQSFPFRKDEGLFLIRGQFQGLALDYQRGWTPATDIVGEVEFRNAGMTATASSATLNGLQVSNGSARFKDFKDATLELKANGSGELRQALEYLQQSPVGPQLGDVFQSLRGEGSMSAEANIVLPLKNIAKQKLNVLARVDNAQVGLEGWNDYATNVKGSLSVRDRAISDITMNGRFLQGPFAVTTVSGTTPTFIASGRTTASQLDNFLRVPGFVKLEGDTDWRLTTTGLVASSASAGNTLFTVDSDLDGLAVKLPAPLGKAAADKRHLRVSAERGNNALLLRASLDTLRGVVSIKKQADGWKFDRAGVRADAMAASLPAQSGLRIEGAIDEFVLDDWLALASGGKNRSAGGQSLNEILRAANVRVGRFKFGGFVWTDVRGVLQATDKDWRVDLSGPDAAGQLLIPYDLGGTRPLVVDMEHLVLNRPETTDSGKSSDSTLDPRDIPALQANVKQLLYGKHDFGEVNLQADKVPQGLQVNSLRANSAAFMVNASGSWWWTPSGQTSSLQLDAESGDLRAAMRQLNYADFIEAKHARLRGDLRWPGGIDENVLARSSGTLEISVDNGQLLTVQPGAGRVVGLLSVAALPRRLSLDFSDLTDKGLSFDSIHGNFNINNGDAHTDNLLLRGPAAEIGLAGRMGFAKRDYDQIAVVTGNVGATLPVAGALAGGPVVGAALLVFTQLFKEPLKGVARGYYHVTGNWENPMVERIDAAEAKESRGASPTETP